jgi:hypothetical protein
VKIITMRCLLPPAAIQPQFAATRQVAAVIACALRCTSGTKPNLSGSLRSSDNQSRQDVLDAVAGTDM